MRHDLDRYHLVMGVVDRVPEPGDRRGAHLRQEMADRRIEVRAYIREHAEDLPEIRDLPWHVSHDGVRRRSIMAR